jgi:hypothetical protein
VAAISLANINDIKPGSYIGAAGIPQPDGSQKALEVHVFPPAMAGTGDGHRPFDLAPNSTMTNGTVGDVVASNTAHPEIQGRREEDRGAGRMCPSSTSKPVNAPCWWRCQGGGARPQEPDGSPQPPTVSAGKNGITPPM